MTNLNPYLYAPFTIPRKNTVFYSERIPTQYLSPTAQENLFVAPEKASSEPKIASMLEDIRQKGIQTPLIINVDDRVDQMKVILGNKRLFAAQRLGIKYVKGIINGQPSAQIIEALSTNIHRLTHSDDVVAVFGGTKAVDVTHLCFDQEQGCVLCVASDHQQWVTSKAGLTPETWVHENKK